MFSLRIVNVDHYMSPPKSGIDLTYSQFRGNQIKSVPVIRIFGATHTGMLHKDLSIETVIRWFIHR